MLPNNGNGISGGKGLHQVHHKHTSARKTALPHPCDRTRATPRKAVDAASQRRIRRHQPSRPVVPSANLRIARRPATPRPNTRSSRRRCAALNLVRFSQPSRATTRLGLQTRSGAAKRHRWAAHAEVTSLCYNQAS
jgi:hypothetical protein